MNEATESEENTAPSPIVPGLPQRGHPDVIRLLEQVLALAKNGKLAGVGVVMATTGGDASTATAGAGAMQISVGAAELHSRMQKLLFSPKVSPIVRAGKLPS